MSEAGGTLVQGVKRPHQWMIARMVEGSTPPRGCKEITIMPWLGEDCDINNENNKKSDVYCHRAGGVG